MHRFYRSRSLSRYGATHDSFAIETTSAHVPATEPPVFSRITLNVQDTHKTRSCQECSSSFSAGILMANGAIHYSLALEMISAGTWIYGTICQIAFFFSHMISDALEVVSNGCVTLELLKHTIPSKCRDG